ncbi:MAG: IS30 family transposase [Candidatus Susulua stagnicola]|nr:IS30 family transposase [Candidatus Susulua stagnicola]
MNKYIRLTFAEREEISRQLVLCASVRNIATAMNRLPSTISREIKRSSPCKNDYRALNGQEYAKQQLHRYPRERKLDKNIKLLKLVHYHIVQKRWTPEQVARRLKILYPNDMSMHISHESIYSYLYVRPRSILKKEIILCLRRHHKNRRSKKERQKSCPIQDYLSIEERPSDVADRIIPGHWEGDLVVGTMNKSAIGTLVERVTRLTLLVKLQAKDAESVRKAFAKEFSNLPNGLKRTLTYDQGQEMSQHKLFTKETDITVYFAHPHSPWERGTNENTNGLVRQFFPKGTDFNKVSKKTLKEVQELLNDRPRKVHDFYTPNEVFYKLLH